MSHPSWEIGDVVCDQEDDDPDPAIIVNIPGVPADEWNLPRFDTTIAEDNPDYPADAPIITVLFEENLNHAFPTWEQDSPIAYDTLNERGLQYYSFPAPRLEPADSPESSETTDPEPNTPADTLPDNESTSPATADETPASALSASSTETSTDDSPTKPSAAVRALEERLENGGMTTELEADDYTIRATKLGDTYRVRPGEVLDGDGPLRSRLEDIVDIDPDDSQITN